MTNIPAKLRSQLAERMPLVELKELTRLTSQDGTVKWLFGLHDGHAIETVVMRHGYGISICVTTQVGCRMGCTFCASTIGGLKRNLSAGEIVAQVVHAQRALDETGERISSIVVMGSGEPFENYDATVTFLELMMDPKAMHIGQRHITVSTSGLVPRIIDFANWDTQITLALSLHAPNDALRSRLMPINRKYPLDTVLDACRYYVSHTGRRITMEYALMHEVNDTVECARELAALLKGMLVHVNLIPVNHVVERDFVRTPPEAVQAFQATLRKHHINTTIRREQGHDIAAACGQLRAQYMASNR
jgi:23S rRNA (adenine2503-C2)-methyltransferase